MRRWLCLALVVALSAVFFASGVVLGIDHGRRTPSQPEELKCLMPGGGVVGPVQTS